jgi:hypothetical protein
MGECNPKVIKMLNASDSKLPRVQKKFNPTYIACWVFLFLVFTN